MFFFEKKNQKTFIRLGFGGGTVREQKFFASFFQKRSAFCLVLLCAATPRLVPADDVTVDYLVHPSHGPEQAVQVSIQGGGAHLRISGQNIPASLLVDRQAGIAYVLAPLLRAYSSIGISRYDPERTVLRRAHFEQGAVEQLAGGLCTDWRAVSPSGTASACITDRGVILKGEASDRSGQLGKVIATRVAFRPQPPWIWSPPTGWRDLTGVVGIAGVGDAQ